MTSRSGAPAVGRLSLPIEARQVGRLVAPHYRTIVPAAILGGSIVITMAVDASSITLVAALAAAVVAVLSPTVGLATLAFMAPLKPPPMIPAPGFHAVLLGAILLGCILRLPIERPSLRISAPLAILFGYVLYVTAQQLPEMMAGYASKADHDVGFLYFQFMTVVGTVVAAGYVLKDRSPFPVLGMALAGATLTAVIAIATFNGPAVGPPFAGLVARSESAVRALGPFGNPNYLGTFAAFAVVLAIGLAASGRSRAWRGALVATAVVGAVAIALAQSRSAIFAVFAGLAAIGLVRSRALGLGIIAAGMAAAVLLYPAFIEWRLENLQVSRYANLTASDDLRLGGVLAGVQLFLSSPVLGIGFGHYLPMSTQVPGVSVPINAHNWYVNVLAEQGIVGVVLWILLAVSLVAALKRRPPAARAVGLAMLATIAVACLFLEAPTSFQTFALPSIVVVACLAGRWEAEEAVGTLATPGTVNRRPRPPRLAT